MEWQTLSLEGIKLLRLDAHADDRGIFLEAYRKSFYQEAGIQEEFVQDNLSYSKKGVLRGMHFQESTLAQPGQAKLLLVVQGEIYDVVVDIRKDSPTFGKWEGVYLRDQERTQLFVPSGFAHGFYVLSDAACVLYKVSRPYDPFLEKGFCYDDPTVGIVWPEPATTSPPILSLKDRKAPSFKELFL